MEIKIGKFTIIYTKIGKRQHRIVGNVMGIFGLATMTNTLIKDESAKDNCRLKKINEIVKCK